MGVSLSTYIVTIIFFAAVLFVVMVLQKKPGNKAAEAEYLEVDELEATGWEIVDEIRQAGEEYVEKLQHKKEEADKVVRRLEEFEDRMTYVSAVDAMWDKKQAMLEDLYQKTKEKLEDVQSKQLLLDQIERLHGGERNDTKVMGEEVDRSAKEKGSEKEFTLEKKPVTLEEKKEEVYRLYEKGCSEDKIAQLTDTHKGFVEVLINMKKMKAT